MTTLYNLPAAGSIALNDVLGVDRSPTGTFSTQKASIGQVLGLIPLATTSTAGLVQIGSGLAITNGVLSATGGGGGSSYVLPTASTSVLGGVKVDGTSVTIANGVISASVGSGATAANPVFTGNITANSPNSSLILGQANNFGTSNIDFRVFGWALNQYDVRLSASGGFINANGQGTLNIVAAQLQLNGVTFTPSNYAPLLSPTFTGTPNAPTPNALDNSTKIATTEFFYNQLAASATVTSLTGGGTAGMVIVNASDAPSVAHEYPFPVINAGGIVTGQVYRLSIRHNTSITSFLAGIPPAGGGISVAVNIRKNGATIANLGAASLSGTVSTVSPAAPVSIAAGDVIDVVVGTITGSLPTTAVISVQPVGVWA